jgi:uncharacterized protein YbcI
MCSQIVRVRADAGSRPGERTGCGAIFSPPLRRRLASSMDSEPREVDPITASGDVRTEISDGLVALLKEYYGRGPDRTKTCVNDDLVVCLLRGGFTRVEQTLLEGGHGDDVIRQRMAFQQVMRARFEEVVEHATRRRVVGFMSGNQQDPDMICEVFVLGPNDVAS